MGFWKVLGGIAAGVGVIVALPVAGPIGVVTAIGAAVGAGIGGLVGAAASLGEEEEKESCRREGERVAVAKYEKKVEKLVVALKDAEGKLLDDKSYFQLLIALFAVGMATANADGNVSEEELADLEQFAAGIGHSNLPPHVKGMFTRLKNKPPTFNAAMQYVNKLDTVDVSLFQKVIEIVSASDGIVTAEETAMLAAFNQAVA